MPPLRHGADYFGLHGGTVTEIDKRYLEEILGPGNLSAGEVLALDEFAIQKGHRCATVFVEPRRKQVLWVCRENIGKQDRVNLKDQPAGILAHCRGPSHPSRLEGINNKIKVIKRAAYGFRDDNDLFLKIHQAFPGIP